MRLVKRKRIHCNHFEKFLLILPLNCVQQDRSQPHSFGRPRNRGDEPSKQTHLPLSPRQAALRRNGTLRPEALTESSRPIPKRTQSSCPEVKAPLGLFTAVSSMPTTYTESAGGIQLQPRRNMDEQQLLTECEAWIAKSKDYCLITGLQQPIGECEEFRGELCASPDGRKVNGGENISVFRCRSSESSKCWIKT